MAPVVAPRTMAEFIVAYGSGATLERAANPGALASPAVAQMVARALGLDTSTSRVRDVETTDATG